MISPRVLVIYLPCGRNALARGNYNTAKIRKTLQRGRGKYIVPVAEHHDGFAMYDSDLSEWTAAKMGPRRDLIGELAAAVREEGLIFGLSLHRAEH